MFSKIIHEHHDSSGLIMIHHDFRNILGAKKNLSGEILLIIDNK